MINFNDPLLGMHDGHLFGQAAAFRPELPTVLLFAACHGRDILTAMTPQCLGRFNVLRLETTSFDICKHDGSDLLDHRIIRDIFNIADVVVTYHMGARKKAISLDAVSKHFKPSAKVITFVAPTFSCLWPIAYGYSAGLGAVALYDEGKSVEDVWRMFINDDFDPLFGIRLRLEMDRIIDREGFHDIGFSQFVLKYIRSIKLWMGASHPSWIITSYIASEILKRIGCDGLSEEQIIGLDPAEHCMRPQPETHYEFRFYHFTYPMRYQNSCGGIEFYRQMFAEHRKHWERCSYILAE